MTAPSAASASQLQRACRDPAAWRFVDAPPIPLGESSSVDALAHHEAGHAVVAVAVGYRIMGATVIQDGLEAGSVTIVAVDSLGSLASEVESRDPDERWGARVRALRLALFKGAGPVAGCLYDGVTPQHWHPEVALLAPESSPEEMERSEHDLLGFVYALRIAAAGSRAELGYQKRAKRLLRRYLKLAFSVVRDVAALLMREGTVEGSDMERAVRESAARHGVDLESEAITAPWWSPPSWRRELRRRRFAAKRSVDP